MDLAEMLWENNAVQDGCDLCQCSRLIADKFRINSGGKTPQMRKNESRAMDYPARMAPLTLHFDKNCSPCQAASTRPAPSPLKPIHNTLTDQRTNNTFYKSSPVRPMSFSQRFCPYQCSSSTADNSSPICSASPLKEPSKPTASSSERNSDKLTIDSENLRSYYSSGSSAVFSSSPISTLGSIKNQWPSKATSVGVSPRSLARKESSEESFMFGQGLSSKFSWNDFGSDAENAKRESKYSKTQKKRNFLKKRSFDFHDEDKENDAVVGGSSSVEKNMDMRLLDSPVAGWSRRHSPMIGLAENGGKTPSKFSVVRNNSPLVLFPYGSPAKKTTPMKVSGHQTFIDLLASQDSGFENSSSFDDRTKMPDLHHEDSESIFSKDSKYEADTSESERHFNSLGDDENDFVKKLRYSSDFEFDTALHDLEEEFDGDTMTDDAVSKYEIISTNSPNVATVHTGIGTIFPTDFEFGSPIGDQETSETFNEPLTRKMPARSETTRMLNFDVDTTSATFEFATPAEVPPKKDKILSGSQESRYGTTNAFERFIQCSESESGNTKKRSRLFDSISTGSIESNGGCISDMEDCMLFDLESEENIAANDAPSNLGALISWEIKNNENDICDEDDDKIDTPNRMLSPKGNGAMRRPLFRRSISLNQESNPMDKVRVTLFKSPGGICSSPVLGKAFKRPEPPGSDLGSESAVKRRCGEQKRVRPLLQRAISDNEATIKMALARSYSEPDLIGDFSKPFVLPLSESKHQDLKAITSDTLAGLIDGDFKDTVHSYQVIDCRYPYEFEGGHIVGAVNLFTEQMVQEALVHGEAAQQRLECPGQKRRVLIFHCEFSSERGPKLCRFLRAVDRALNRDSYPSLLHPELYVLRGGYRHFHTCHGRLCRPVAGAYTPMTDPSHSEAMKTLQAFARRRRRPTLVGSSPDR